jgi:hypothetical protein
MGNHCIRKITSSGVVTTLAGSGTAGFADGTGTTAMFYLPFGIAVDSLGNVYVADTYNNCIRKITSGVVTTTLYVALSDPRGIAVDISGNIYVADTYNNRIRKITSSGVESTLAGSGNFGTSDGTGINAEFYNPRGLSIDSSGNIYVADTGNDCIRKITFTSLFPPPLPVCDSSWHHVAFTYTGSISTSIFTTYIDGVQISSTSASFSISSASTSTLQIGFGGIGSTFYTGSISDIRIFSRILSASEVIQLTRPPPSPTATASKSSGPSSSSSLSARSSMSSAPTTSAAPSISSMISSVATKSAIPSLSARSSMSTVPTTSTVPTASAASSFSSVVSLSAAPTISSSFTSTASKSAAPSIPSFSSQPSMTSNPTSSSSMSSSASTSAAPSIPTFTPHSSQSSNPSASSSMSSIPSRSATRSAAPSLSPSKSPLSSQSSDPSSSSTMSSLSSQSAVPTKSSTSTSTKSSTSSSSATTTSSASPSPPCPAGRFREGLIGSYTCTDCSAGTASNIIGSTSSSSCLDCPPGTFSTPGSSLCRSCLPGTISKSSRSITCDRCLGRGEAAINSSTCSSCEIHTRTNGSACLSCNPGFYCDGAVAIACRLPNMCLGTRCASGSSGLLCETCLTGYYKTEDGCAPCSTFLKFVFIIPISLVFAIGVIVYLCRTTLKKLFLGDATNNPPILGILNLSSTDLFRDLYQRLILLSSLNLISLPLFFRDFTKIFSLPFGFELISPGCLLPGWSFGSRWLATVLFIVVVLGICIFLKFRTLVSNNVPIKLTPPNKNYIFSLTPPNNVPIKSPTTDIRSLTPPNENNIFSSEAQPNSTLQSTTIISTSWMSKVKGLMFPTEVLDLFHPQFPTNLKEAKDRFQKTLLKLPENEQVDVKGIVDELSKNIESFYEKSTEINYNSIKDKFENQTNRTEGPLKTCVTETYFKEFVPKEKFINAYKAKAAFLNSKEINATYVSSECFTHSAAFDVSMAFLSTGLTGALIKIFGPILFRICIEACLPRTRPSDDKLVLWSEPTTVLFEPPHDDIFIMSLLFIIYIITFGFISFLNRFVTSYDFMCNIFAYLSQLAVCFRMFSETAAAGYLLGIDVCSLVSSMIFWKDIKIGISSQIHSIGCCSPKWLFFLTSLILIILQIIVLVCVIVGDNASSSGWATALIGACVVYLFMLVVLWWDKINDTCRESLKTLSLDRITYVNNPMITTTKLTIKT